MNRSGLLVGLLLLLALLSGCFLIPDMEIEDVFGFNNVVVDFTLSEVNSTSDGIAPQAVVAAGSTERVVDVSDIDLPFNPSPAQASEGMSARLIRLFRPAPDAELPTTLSLDSASFTARFTDGDTTFDEVVSASFAPALFERDDASCNNSSCEYLPTGDARLVLDLSSSEIAEILAILATPLEPKVASGEATLRFSDDPLLASVTQAQIQVEASGGIISFR